MQYLGLLILLGSACQGVVAATSGVSSPVLGRAGNYKRAERLPIRRKDGELERRGHDTENDTTLPVISPKVMLISTFAPEADVWYGDETTLDLFAQNITVTGLSPIWPDVHCDARGEVCQITSGLGIVNAASSMQALWLSKRFDLKQTYFLVAAIAGINPHEGTTGSVTFAEYVVTLDLQYSFGANDVPQNDTSAFFPLGSMYPDSTDAAAFPTSFFGWEVFELNKNLVSHAAKVVSTRVAQLNDSAAAGSYRAKYDFAPANQPPAVQICASGASNLYWSGAYTGYAFQNYTRLVTNGSATYCATNTEDSGLHEGLLRGALAGALDYGRVINMRTASDFDRAPPGVDPVFHLLYADQGGFHPSLVNIRLAGLAVVDDILGNWTTLYEKGVKPTNYIGDAFGSLMGQKGVVRDIGPKTPDDDMSPY